MNNLAARLALRILRLFMSKAEAQSVLGDLEEEGGSTFWNLYHSLRISARCVWERCSLRQRQFGRGHTLDKLAQDIRYACRVLLKNRSFSAVAVLALTLGIGATTTVFSILDATIFRPLPFPNPEQLYRVTATSVQVPTPGPLFEEYDAWTASKDIFDSITAAVPQQLQISGVAEPEILQGRAVAASFFDMVSVRPFLGRAFTAEDDRPGGPAVVVLGYGMWQRIFGGDRTIPGRSIVLGDQPYTVIGVMPRGFGFPAVEPQILVPLNRDPATITRVQPLFVYARLKLGTTPEQAAAGLARISEDLERELPVLMADRVARLISLHEEVTGTTGKLPITLLGAVVFVLLIAVVNVANLMLGHASTRAQEIAVRLSVGASRWRIVRQLLTESLLLSALAGILGFAMTTALLGSIAALLPENVPRLSEIGIHWRVAAFATAVSLIAGVLFGLYPAWSASRQSLAESLKLGRQTFLAGMKGRAVRGVLTIAEIGLAVMLSVGAGLLLKSFAAVLAVDIGVKPENVVMFHVPAERMDWKNPLATRIARYERLIGSVSSMAGVSGAAMSSNVPLIVRVAVHSGLFRIPEHPVSLGKDLRIPMLLVSPSYFSIMGAPVLRGRGFTDADNRNAEAVVSENTARVLWPGQGPLGKTILRRINRDEEEVLTVVGVVKEVKKTWYEASAMSRLGVDATIYLPLLAVASNPPSFLVVRTASDPRPLIPDLRRAIWAADPKQPIQAVDLFDDVIEKDLRAPRFRAFLLGSFAAIAVLIAVIGIYGVLSHAVMTRMHEMGVRMAMGAGRRDILRLVVGQGLLLVLIGVLLGIAASFGLTKLIAAYLFKTEPFDGVILAAVAALFGVIALVACWIPARRASKADPLTVLRCE